MNPYLKAQREKYDALRKSIEGLQTRAAEAGRDLTEDELRAVTEQGEQARKLAEQIESLSEIETRNRKVAELANAVAEDTRDEQTRSRGDEDETRATRVGGAVTRDRDPGHYTRSSRNSFFGDMHLSRQGDEAAARRLAEHNRALSTGTNGPGLVPPHWLTEEFEQLARQGRRLADAVRRIPLGNDPRPITMPKQTVGTDAVVAEQATENTSVGSADAYDSDTTTVTPKPTAGMQIVSRQMLDMSNPAVDQLIYADLLAVYNDKLEAKVGTALITAAGAATVTFASEATNWDVAGVPSDSVIDLAIAVRNARKLPGDILAMRVNRYGEFLKLKDGSGRPLIPLDTAGPQNVIGVGSVAVDGRIAGLGVIATDALGSGYPESYLVLRASDTILFESDVLQFRYEEPLGPESVKLGIWGYTAVHVKHSGKSVKRAEITAA